MNYLIVAPTPCFPVSATEFAVESAFAEHLRQLQRMYADRFDGLVLAAPVMTRETYEERRSYLAVLDAAADKIALEPMHGKDVGPARYWLRELVPNVRRLRRAVDRAAIVHSGPSHLYRPFECIALWLAARRRKATIFVMDVDERRSSWMNYKTGRWSLKSYLLARWLYDPFVSLQTRWAARSCSLLFLKGRRLCEDFGRGNPRVKNIVDSAFSPEHLASAEAVERKVARLRDVRRPLETVYFGRLTAYKGIDRSIEAVARAVRGRGAAIRFHVIGTGEEEPVLRALANRLDVAESVVFHGAIPFGPRLFERLRDCDLLLATPLAEDTPRNALDAMASGVPILAFDTYYYHDLHDSGAVEVVPWPSVDAFANRLASVSADKASLEPAVRAAVRFAEANTQESWLRRRHGWTIEALDSLAASGR